jgi:hypothetical protein
LKGVMRERTLKWRVSPAARVAGPGIVEGGDGRGALGVDGSRAGGCRGRTITRRPVASFLEDPDAAPPPVVPGRGQVQGLVAVEVGVQGAHVVLVPEHVLKPLVLRSQPHSLLVVLHRPLPVHGCRTPPPLPPQPQPVLGGTGGQGDGEGDVLYGDVGRGDEGDAVIQHPLVLQGALHLHGEVLGRGLLGPPYPPPPCHIKCSMSFRSLSLRSMRE